MPRKFFEKPKPSQSDRVPPGQYLAKGFPVLSYGETPQVSKDQWLLKVWGLVENKTFWLILSTVSLYLRIMVDFCGQLCLISTPGKVPSGLTELSF
jgi:hypothetical protein